MASEFISQRGKTLLVYENYKFNKFRTLATGETKWRCINRKCQAFLNTLGPQHLITNCDSQHSHGPVSCNILQRQSVTAAAKRKAIDDLCEKPSKNFHSCIGDSHVNLQVNDVKCIKKNMYYYRRKSKLALSKNSDEVTKCGEIFTLSNDREEQMGPSAGSKAEGLLIKDVVEKLEAWAPLHLAGSWDRVGLQVEPSGQFNRVTRLLVTNDLTEAVVEEAVAKGGIGMIISYHPPIFQALKTLTNRTWKERVIKACIENKIAVYSPHTAWDAVSGGVNDWLASAFDSSLVKPLTVSKTWTLPGSSEKRVTHQLEIIVLGKNTLQQSSMKKLEKYAQDMGAPIKYIINTEDDSKVISIGCDESSLTSLVEFIQHSSSEFDGFHMKVSKYEQIPWPKFGEGRFCTLKTPLPLKKIVDVVKCHLKLKNVRLATACSLSTDSPVHTVALCAGSGSSVLSGVRADVLLTGEMGHHDVLEANHRGSHVILCEHSNTERGFLCSLVEKKFLHTLLEGNVEIIMSSKDKEPLQTV